MYENNKTIKDYLDDKWDELADIGKKAIIRALLKNRKIQTDRRKK